MKGALLLDVVGESAAVLKLLVGEGEALLVRRCPLASDLRHRVVDRVGELDLKRDGLAAETLDEDLTKTCMPP